VPSPRTVVIAGAGIGGLTASLALARSGFRVVVLERAERLEETGAGIQLSPNASRILISLGLRECLLPCVVAPDELKVADAPTGRVVARAPLGPAVASRYGAPYWSIHRGDLQAALLGAVEAEPHISLRLGVRVDDFAADGDGVAVTGHDGLRSVEQRGIALIGADGIWSQIRKRLGHGETPRFTGHTAWRALVPAEGLPPELRLPAINLWFGGGAHLVHYPVSGGRLVNVVAIVPDDWRETGWSAPGERSEILACLSGPAWRGRPRAVLEAAQSWLKWALCDAAPLPSWSAGAATLLGDAAHPMMPYLAQGAAMAIEDAAMLAECMGREPDDPASALKRYEQSRLARTARTQRAAQRNGRIYHLGPVGGFARTMALTFLGARLLQRYDWLYRWTPT
jgi:salicylate hydroxylase